MQKRFIKHPLAEFVPLPSRISGMRLILEAQGLWGIEEVGLSKCHLAWRLSVRSFGSTGTARLPRAPSAFAGSSAASRRIRAPCVRDGTHEASINSGNVNENTTNSSNNKDEQDCRRRRCDDTLEVSDVRGAHMR